MKPAAERNEALKKAGQLQSAADMTGYLKSKELRPPKWIDCAGLQADRWRRLARGSNDVVTQQRLLKLAAEYEAQADAQDGVDEQAPAVRYGKGYDDDD